MSGQELIIGMEPGMQAAKTAPADFEQLMERHQRRVLGTALRLLGNMADAQDAAQEVFLRLHKYRNRFDEDRELGPWLYRMTVNICHDLRHKRREMPLPENDEVVDRDAGVEASLDRQTRLRQVERALERLPEKMRAAIVLRDIEGLSTREVAEILGSSEVTVRSQISTGRLRLREMIGKKS